MKLISWLQHHWCLYICWLIQFPAMCCFAFATFFAWAVIGEMSPFGTEGKLMLGLCCITILVYVCQIFESIYITYLGYYFRKRIFPLHMPPETWLLIARAVWIGLPVVVATFYILLATSLVVWYRIRKNKQNSMLGKDGEELENLLHGENYV